MSQPDVGGGGGFVF